jgi:hypothetical protein
MYNTDFICTYKLIEQKSDFIDEADILYKIQFLQAFNLDDFDTNKINNEVEQLYSLLKDYPLFKEIIKLSQFYNETIDGEKMAFMSFFSYDIFHILHSWLCEYINKKEISEETHNKLKYLLNKK